MKRVRTIGMDPMGALIPTILLVEPIDNSTSAWEADSTSFGESNVGSSTTSDRDARQLQKAIS